MTEQLTGVADLLLFTTLFSLPSPFFLSYCLILKLMISDMMYFDSFSFIFTYLL